MAVFGSKIRAWIKVMEVKGADVKQVVNEVAEAATIAAIEVATENTPPNGDAALSGTSTRKGEMAQHWSIDSKTKPRNGVTYLKNKLKYASYVNDGHAVDKHFVPELIINGNKLERSPDGKGGITVGTRTTYVPGLYMVEKAKKRYSEVVHKELSRRVSELYE